MGEQERYKNMLKKIIDETESEKIQTSEELIRTLVQELNMIGVKSQHSVMK